MSTFNLKPTHSPVKAYYDALAQFQLHGHTTEGNTRSAFADLLKKCCGPYDWHLTEEFAFRGRDKQSLRADGALIDRFTLQHGIWEAKDSADDLTLEIKKKLAKGYPTTNTLFQSPTHAVLYQDNRIAFDEPITDPEKLVEVLRLFFEHQQPDIPDWKEAVAQFSAKIAELAAGVNIILAAEHKRNPTFRENFQSFAELCRQSINPDLGDPAIQNMLVQHLLTERIFRKVFNNNEFLRRNVIAVEIEKVISSITARYFSRDEFLKPLDRFYKSIERAAEAQTEYTEKQTFLNAVYEKFFQNFDTKQADTHGIVYTPQPIVDFMVRSVEEILQQEFGKSLSDKGVHILDPFTGTGNFITRIMQQIKRSALPQKYAEELHCNEIMLLPYYIASMNIEHAYMESSKEYRSFEGICLVDTFTTLGQGTFFTSENTARIKRQSDAPIRVVIGNPPYNMGQASEADDNKNRRYRGDGEVDIRVARTYVADSKATLRNKLSDPYVKAFRWASDRIKSHGIVCFVTNNSFIDQIAFDGMRKHLARDFTKLYIIDLGGNVRHNPSLSGTTHNVFGIQVGVAISILVKQDAAYPSHVGQLRFVEMDKHWRKERKYAQLSEWSLKTINWREFEQTNLNDWRDASATVDTYSKLMPLGNKNTKQRDDQETIFSNFSLGTASSRDVYNYNENALLLRKNIDRAIAAYNRTLDAYRRLPEPRPNPDDFIDNAEINIKWTRQTKASLGRLQSSELDDTAFRKSAYRPFRTLNSYFQDFWNEERYQLHRIFPTPNSQNFVIGASGVGAERPFAALSSRSIPDLNFFGPGTVPNWFPFYTFDTDGTNRRENITDWALAEFRTHYADKNITKWDIFHATYAVLHHPEYRIRYAANLKRELPRIPFPPDFHAFAAAGARLMELHIDYEKQKPYKLEQIEDPKAEVSFRVEKMKLSKDKSELRYNDFLLLRGIPAAAFDYRLGNRSALEWVIDQYRVSTDARSGIVNDPNRADDPHYILRLIGQVIQVSLETQQVIASLPSLNLPQT